MGASVNDPMVSDADRNDIEDCVSWETTCWGCGLRVVLPRHAPMFRCGWCGAITSERTDPPQPSCSRGCCKAQQVVVVSMVLMAITVIICAGIWATFPATASMGFYLHSAITAWLSFNTLFNFCMAAFQAAGPSTPEHHDDAKMIIGRQSLDGYKFCGYCRKPKPPNSHHCRNCHLCVVEMDHHCPFIGNCVGSNNLRHFLLFLVYAMASGVYLFAMTLSAASRVWPAALTRFVMAAMPLASSGVVVDLASVRAFVLFYLIVTSAGLAGGCGVLLYQQVKLVCAGETYIHSLISHARDREKEKVRSWGNLRRVFGNRHPCLWLLPPSISTAKPTFSLGKTH